MKRSEILKIIEDLYNLEIQNYPKESSSDIFAENLLANLESKGMLPPPAEIVNVSPYGNDSFILEIEYKGKDIAKSFPFSTWEN